MHSASPLPRSRFWKLCVFYATNALNIFFEHQHFRDHFLSGQLIIWKMWFLWLSFCSFTAVSYVCNNMALTLYQSIFATKDEYTTRPLIFPLWLPKDDPYKTPNYETFLLIEIYVILIIVQNFGCKYGLASLGWTPSYYVLVAQPDFVRVGD